MEFREIIAKFIEKNEEVVVENTTPAKQDSKIPSLKKVFEDVEKKRMREAEQITIAPAKQNTQVIKQGNKTLGTVTNPNLASQIKQSIGKGEMSLAGTEIKEDDVEESGLQAYLGNKKYGKAGMDALRKAGREGASKEKMAQIRAKHDKLDEVQVDEKAKNPYAIGMAAAKKAAGITKKHATDLPKGVVVKGHEIAKKIKKKEKMDEVEQPTMDNMTAKGAGLGAGRSDKVLEAKPDFLDLDKDGNKKETMKKAAADKKKKVKESMNPKLKAAYQEGNSHGLRELSCRVKHYQDMEEAKQYFEGYVKGLEECYGMSNDPKMGDRQSPVLGLVGETMPASTATMAKDASGLGEMDKTAYMQFKAKQTPGDTFKAFGQTHKDSDVLETDAFTFESLEQQLSDLLQEDTEVVSEGLSVSMSTGQQGSPDSVSVTGTDDEAGKLLAFIKQVGLGGMGGAEAVAAPAEVVTVSDYGAPKGDNSDMKALLQKVGVGSEDGDYKPEGSADHEHSESCGCEDVKEVQTQDQTLYATTSESDNSEDDGFDASARNTELDNVGKPASGGATNEDGAEAPGSNSVGQQEQEDAEEVNEESTEKMDQHAEKAAEKVKKDIEYDDKKDREHDKLDEWANNVGQKGTDTAFEQDIEFMTKVISGGLNKPKVTGQTTVPVIAGQDARDGSKEDLASWMKLAGLKK